MNSDPDPKTDVADHAMQEIVKTTQYEYHHMGIPTTVPRAGEHYSSRFKMYVSGGEDSQFRVQWHRYEADSPLHPLVQTVPHVAFKVPSIDEAIKGKKVILDPYYPFPGFRVAMIDEKGSPIELIETSLSEQEIWYGSKENTFIFPKTEQS